MIIRPHLFKSIEIFAPYVVKCSLKNAIFEFITEINVTVGV
jgi:hypothetical protein